MVSINCRRLHLPNALSHGSKSTNSSGRSCQQINNAATCLQWPCCPTGRYNCDRARHGHRTPRKSGTARVGTPRHDALRVVPCWLGFRIAPLW